MNELNIAKVRGQFGTEYSFRWFHIPKEASRIPKSGGIYIVAKAEAPLEGEPTIEGLFLGESKDFSSALQAHPQQACFEKQGANIIGVLPLPNPEAAIPIKFDLSALVWPCGIA